MFELAKIAFTDVARLARSGKALTILPVGVVEEHGAHLPLGLDSFAAEVYCGGGDSPSRSTGIRGRRGTDD